MKEALRRNGSVNLVSVVLDRIVTYRCRGFLTMVVELGEAKLGKLTLPQWNS